MLVAGSLYLAYVFSYLYLWTVSPQAWPSSPAAGLPEWTWPAVSAALLAASGAGVLAARRAFSGSSRPGAGFVLFLIMAAAALCMSLAAEVAGHWLADLRPTQSSYGAMVYMAAFLQFELVATLAVMAVFLIARVAAGRLSGVRRVTFDNTALLWLYAVGQGLLGLLLVHGFPRLVG
jgi:cytochrome c oxidase subunit I+III